MNPLLIGSLVGAGMIALLVIPFVSRRFDRAVRSRTLRSLREMPENVRIVVLGCTPRLRSGSSNRYFTERAAAAAAAYHSRPDSRILCTGRVEENGDDEAEALLELLVSASVPRSAIDLDRESERTIDSIDFVATYHADRPILLVTQAFHMPRVLFLARHRGLEAWGLTAKGPQPGIRVRTREHLARMRALLDTIQARPR